jgi:hypothetical protein
MRVSIGDVSLFFEVLGREWVVDDAVQRRRPVDVGIHGGPRLGRHAAPPPARAGSPQTKRPGPPRTCQRGTRPVPGTVTSRPQVGTIFDLDVSARDTSGARHRDVSSTARRDLGYCALVTTALVGLDVGTSGV